MHQQSILEAMTRHVEKSVIVRSMLIGGIADEVDHFASRIIDHRAAASIGSNSRKTSL